MLRPGILPLPGARQDLTKMIISKYIKIYQHISKDTKIYKQRHQQRRYGNQQRRYGYVFIPHLMFPDGAGGYNITLYIT